MLGFLARKAAAHRIAMSRIFVVGFFISLLVAEGAHEGSLIAPSLFLLGLVLVGVATVGRLWCSLYISGYKNNELITTGPYSVSRNPLYFFSFIGFAGIGFATETVTMAIVLPVAFLIGYRTVIEREEQELQARFGPEFAAYRACTPRFFPDLSKFAEPPTYAVNPAQFRRTMGDVVWFIWLVGIIELVEALHELHVIEPLLLLQ